MSSFFRTVSDSDTSSDEEEELTDSGSEETQDSGSEASESEAEKEKPKIRSRFLKTEGSDDSDSDDGARVVKSAKSKRVEEIEAIVKGIENGAKINDWSLISSEYDKLIRLMTKPGASTNAVPVSFLRLLSSFDETITQAQALKKKMNATNAKALNSMKQKIKKSQKEHDEVLAKYKQDPEGFEASLLASEKEKLAESKAKPKTKRVASADDEDFQTVGKAGKALPLASTEGIYKTLAQVVEARGKKNTDKNEQVRILEQLMGVTHTTYQTLRVLSALISNQLDYTVSSQLSVETWTAALENIDRLLQILLDNPDYIIGETLTDYDEMAERAPSQEEPVIYIRGSVMSLLDRLSDELLKSLQSIDPNTPEYVQRLSDEKKLYKSIVAGQVYCERAKLREQVEWILMRRLEVVYYKPDVVIDALEASLPSSIPQSTLMPAYTNASSLVHSLCIALYKTPSSLLRTRAMLLHIYHSASSSYAESRSLLLMSHLQETIGGSDIHTQILYNRAVVQVGIAAFREGHVRECQGVLQEIFASQRVRELLAQGGTVRYGMTPEQERAEKQRKLPFHMHINLELLEAVYLVSSMLLEVPRIAQSQSSSEEKKRVISRTFRRQLEYSNRQIFTGPAENKRDAVMLATRALLAGEWEKCVSLIYTMKIWTALPTHEKVLEMLTRKIQEEGLKTFVFSSAGVYTSLSLSSLGQRFKLDRQVVERLVSKMIWESELEASLDGVSGLVIFHPNSVASTQHSSGPALPMSATPIQKLGYSLSEKAAQMVDSSERYIDSKIGSGEGQKEREKEGGAKEGGRERKGQRGKARTRGVGRQFQAGMGRSLKAGA